MAKPLQTSDQLPDTLVDAITRGLAINSHGEPVPLHSNISIDEAAVLYRLVRELSPAVTVEIGFAQGVSTLAILKAHADNDRSGVHHVIDPLQAQYDDVGLAMVRAAGLEPWMRFHRQFADEVVPNLPRIQCAFIDSSHLFDLTISEFVLMDKRLDVGGAVAFHDMWMPSLQKVLRYILSNRSYELASKEATAQPDRRRTFRARAKRTLVDGLNRLPMARWVLNQEILCPWSILDVPNLAVLRKTAEDARDWRFHKVF